MIPSPSRKEGISKPSLEFSPGAGYWIAPDGHAFPVTTHIAAICECPERFGLNGDHLREAFQRYDEPWASEGDARREIILSVINQSGWIRVRHYRRTGWTVNLPALDHTVLDRLFRFFHDFLPNEHNLESVRLDHPNGILKTEVLALVRREHSYSKEIHEGSASNRSLTRNTLGTPSPLDEY